MKAKIGAIVSLIAAIALWVACLRYLLSAADHGEFGAYLMAAGVFMLLPFCCVAFIYAILRSRTGWATPARSDLLPVPQRAVLDPAGSSLRELAWQAREPGQLEQWSQPSLSQSRLVAREVTVTRELYQ